MRKKVFFSHLLDSDKYILLLEKLLEIEQEKLEILDMIDSTLHHRVMNLILQELNEEHHEFFIKEYSQNPGNVEILIFLKKQIPDIESKIRKESKSFHAELKNDIHKLRTK